MLDPSGFIFLCWLCGTRSRFFLVQPFAIFHSRCDNRVDRFFHHQLLAGTERDQSIRRRLDELDQLTVDDESLVIEPRYLNHTRNLNRLFILI